MKPETTMKPGKSIADFVRLSVPLLCSGDMSDTDFAFFGGSFGRRNGHLILGVIFMVGCPWIWLKSGAILQS